jgi:hypothetical protein
VRRTDCVQRVVLALAVLASTCLISACGGSGGGSSGSAVLSLTAKCADFTNASVVAQTRWARAEGRPRQDSSSLTPTDVQNSLNVVKYYCSSNPDLLLGKVPTLRNLREFFTRLEQDASAGQFTLMCRAQGRPASCQNQDAATAKQQAAQDLRLIPTLTFTETSPGVATAANPYQPQKTQTFTFKGDPATGGIWSFQ